MATLTTGALGAVLFPLLREVFGASYEELTPFHERMVEVDDSTQAFEDFLEIAPFGDVPRFEEGNAVSLDTVRQSYRTRYEHLDYAVGFEVTHQLARDDKTRTIRMLPEELSKSVGRSVETIVAGMFNDGFDATITHPTEGQPLFSTSHPTFSGNRANRPSTNTDPTLSGIQQMQIDNSNTRDARGNRTNVYTKFIFANPFNQSLLKRNAESPDDPTTAARSINPYHRTFDWAVNPYITLQRAFFGKTNVVGAYWFWRERAKFSEMPVADHMKRRFMVHFAASLAWHNWRGYYASPGIGSGL